MRLSPTTLQFPHTLITFLWHFLSLDLLSMLPTKSGMPASLLFIFIHVCAFNLLPSLTFFIFTLLSKFRAGSRAQLRPTRKQNMLPVAGINILQWDFRFSMQWLWSFLWHCEVSYLYCTARSHTPTNNKGWFTHNMPCPCCAHATPMLFSCHTVPLIHTCLAVPLPCTDSAVSFVKVHVAAENFRTASPTV